MRLSIRKSGSKTFLYALKSFRDEHGKSTSMTVRKFGSVEELSKFMDEDPIEWAKREVEKMTEEENEQKRVVTVSYNPAELIDHDEQVTFNCGYLFLQQQYHKLGLDTICESISKRHKAEFDLDGILKALVYTRILYPGSKLSSYEDAKNFIEQPKFELHQIYRALSLLAKESDFIQAKLYKNSVKAIGRNTSVIYYDCTNYYFESEVEEGMRQYGMSKEHRPNPIVQMGLFMDTDGMPLAFCVNPGNTAETTTLKPLEKKLQEDFGMSRVIVCTDAGLASNDNRINNDGTARSFITVQSVKRLSESKMAWALDPTGWRIKAMDADGTWDNSGTTYDISKLDDDIDYDKVFFKETLLAEDVWVDMERDGQKVLDEKGRVKRTKTKLIQRLIVTYSIKYREYLRETRARQIARAEKKISKGPAAVEKPNQNSPSRFIQATSVTDSGEMATTTFYGINQDMIEQEKRFDGFYAVCSDLGEEYPAQEILKMNGMRWMVEDGFRITKTDFRARPVYLRRDERITAHFMTCFLALMLIKCLMKRVNLGKRATDAFSVHEVIDTLKDMNLRKERGEGYIPNYKRTEMTDRLHGSAGFRTDTQIVTMQKMKGIIAETKKK